MSRMFPFDEYPLERHARLEWMAKYGSKVSLTFDEVYGCWECYWTFHGVEYRATTVGDPWIAQEYVIKNAFEDFQRSRQVNSA